MHASQAAVRWKRFLLLRARSLKLNRNFQLLGISPCREHTHTNTKRTETWTSSGLQATTCAVQGCSKVASGSRFGWSGSGSGCGSGSGSGNGGGSGSDSVVAAALLLVALVAVLAAGVVVAVVVVVVVVAVAVGVGVIPSP